MQGVRGSEGVREEKYYVYVVNNFIKMMEQVSGNKVILGY